jgi:hypothetical protein
MTKWIYEIYLSMLIFPKGRCADIYFQDIIDHQQDMDMVVEDV